MAAEAVVVAGEAVVVAALAAEAVVVAGEVEEAAVEEAAGVEAAGVEGEVEAEAAAAPEDWLVAPWTAWSRWASVRSKRGWAGSIRPGPRKAQGLRRQPPTEEGQGKRPMEPEGGEKADAA